MNEGHQGSRRIIAVGLSSFAIALLGVVQFLAAYDTTSMNVALADIVRDLHTTVQGVQSAIAFYPLVLASFMLVGGKLADILGRRRVLLIGLAIYGIGALVTALSPNLGAMALGWSLLEGIGAALMLPAVYTIVLTSREGASSSSAIGVVGSMAAAGAALGPLLAGAITTTISWRASFGLEVVAVAAILCLWRRLPDPRYEGTRPKLDLVGAALSAVAFGVLALGVMMGSIFGWWTAWQPLSVAGYELIPKGGVSPTLLAIAAGLALTLLLVMWLRGRERRGLDPLVHLGMLRSSAVSAGLVASVTRRMGERGIFLVIPVFLQVSLQLSAFRTGLMLMPMSLCAVVVAAQAGRLSRRWDHRDLLRAGLGLQVVGLAMMVVLVGREAPELGLLPGLVVFGLGIGLAGPPESVLVVAGVESERRAEASGLFRSANNMGSALGIAIAGSLLLTLFASSAREMTEASTVLPKAYKVAILSIETADIETLSDAEAVALLEGENPAIKEELIEINRVSRDEAIAWTAVAMGLLLLLGLLATRRIPRTKTPPPTRAARGPVDSS